MKIAIFQNFLDTIGGAEVVGLTMARELKADIYTTNVDREKIRQMGFDDVAVISIGRVPVNAPFRQQLVLWRFRRLNLKGKYDFFIINGDWALSAAVNNRPNLWYVNATARELYDMRDYIRKNLIGSLKKLIFDVWVMYNRYLNSKYVSHIASIASNSVFTQVRVKKYLHRESELVYPPTQTNKFHFEKTGDYWLSVNRIISYKRIDIQMKAFAQLPNEKLIILGPYEKSSTSIEYVDLVKKIKPPNVTIIEGADSFQELVNYYANCKGFITTCLNEDFGMTAIEAMASGKPVIAPYEGGYRETVIDGKTGLHIKDINPEKLVEAVKRVGLVLIENPNYYVKACQLQAVKFDISVFIAKLRKMMEL